MGSLSRNDRRDIREAVRKVTSPWGRRFFVSSTHTRASDLGTGLDAAQPLATLVQAVANALAGDEILVQEGHVEVVNTSEELDFSLDNMKVIGFGQGDQRPKITVNGVIGANVLVSGDGVHLHNIRLDGGLDLITALMEVTGDDFLGTDLGVSQSTGQPVTAILLTTADRARILNLDAVQAGAGATSCIAIVGGNDIEITGCRITGDYGAANISNTGTLMLRTAIHHNFLDNHNAIDVCIDVVGTTVGWIAHNACRVATDAQTTWVDAGDAAQFENYGVNNDGETGILTGTPSV